ncbi:MAG: hypothetical protein MZV65_43995 [Chromatiales bacterium]|nr:hypothetical protein [Chromatiales bacterium]
MARTLDAAIQRHAVDALRRQLAELAGRNVEDGAVVVLDNASGDVAGLCRLQRRAFRRGGGGRRARAAPGGLDPEALPL